MNREDMLARLIAQANAQGGDFVTLRAIVEEASELGAGRVLDRLGLAGGGLLPPAPGAAEGPGRCRFRQAQGLRAHQVSRIRGAGRRRAPASPRRSPSRHLTSHNEENKHHVHR